ncbi:hypothetical protein JCM13210_13700 [Thermaerobacter litoralis]
MAPPDSGTDTCVWTWSALAMGFALLAAGVPGSSLGLFGLLADVAEQKGVPWWVAGAMAGAATVMGHGASYLFFAHFGQPVLSALSTKIPHLGVAVHRLRLLLAQDRPLLALLALRWVGLGYTQVFWLLATAGIGRPSWLGLLFLNDWLWALIWTYMAAGLVRTVPGAGEWLVPGAAALVVFSLVAGAWGVVRYLRRSGGAS